MLKVITNTRRGSYG